MTNFDVMKKTLMKRIDELSKEQLYTLISIIEEINQDYSSVFISALVANFPDGSRSRSMSVFTSL